MTPALVAVLIALAPPKVAAPGLRVFELPPQTASLYTEHLCTQLAIQGLRVISQRDIESLLGMERQKQFLGCADAASSCMAELSSALGADAVLIGDLIKSGAGVQVNLKLIDAANGETISIVSRRASSVDDVLDVLTNAAEPLAEPLLAKRGGGAASGTRGSRLRPWMFGTLGAGVAGLAVGAVGFAVAYSNASKLAPGSPRLDPGAETGIIATGRTWETIGWVSASVGVAAIAATVIAMLALPPGDSVPSVGVAASAAGAMLSLEWRAP